MIIFRTQKPGAQILHTEHCCKNADICFLKYCNGFTKEAVRRTDYMLMNGKKLSGIENSEDYITL